MPANPFRYGDLALDEAFTDRDDEVAELKADLRNGQNVVVIAPRRYGKSSLVWRVAQELVREGVLVAQVDLMKTPTKQQLAARLAKTILDDVATPLMRARERLRVFAGLQVAPTIIVEPATGGVAFSFAATYRGEDIDATLERLLELPAQLAGERNRRLALVFDEFQEVVSIDPGLPKLMRAVFQEQPDVAHVYLGSRRHMMDRIFNDENEPFWRSAKTISLGVIPPELWRPYVVARFRRAKIKLDDGVADRALVITRGHPYATQELFYYLWEEVAERGTGGDDALDAALAKVLRSEHAHFSLIWERATRTQRLLMLALAREPGRVLADDYGRRHDLPNRSTAHKALGVLEDDELVLREPDGWRIAEPFLTEWILRNES